MNILAHRGIWKADSEKNSFAALKNAITSEFGIETDVRDFGNKLLISHDPPTGSELNLELFLSFVESIDPKSPIALNIKADGLQKALISLAVIERFPNLYIFDASIPDLFQYCRLGFSFFTRLSEIEQTPVLNSCAKGIWLDQFEETWFNQKLLEAYAKEGKLISIVSPELHKRDYMPFWEQLRSWLQESNLGSSISLCTDHPVEARDYFYE